MRRIPVLSSLSTFWRSWVLILTPLVCAVVFLNPEDDMAMRCAYVLLIMAVYWVTEVWPVAITALIPVALFPLLGIMSTGDVTLHYMKSTNFLFMGGLMMALAVENSGLHTRIALSLLLRIGTRPAFVMLAFMATTAFLSMWISNTAATAMMIPIVEAVARTMEGKEDKKAVSSEDDDDDAESDTSSTTSTPEKSGMSRKQMLLLSIAYAANIGGTGVITGSPPNLVLPEKLKEAFGPVHPLSFFNWMLFAVPLMIVNLVLAFLWLSFYEWFDQRMQRRKDENSMKQARINEGYDGSTEVVGNGYCEQGRQTSIKDDLESLERDPEKERNIRQVIEEQYLALGGWKAQEVTIAICFTLLICLWFFRDPRVFPGWLALFHYKDVKIGDATMTVFMVLVVFSLPTHLRFWPFQPALHKAHRSQALLQWGGDKGVERRLQWGVILLLGGGFALSEGCETSGLSSWVGARLSGILTSPLLSSFLICLITTGITEFASNTATANVLIPILVNTSRQLCLNPIYLSLVCTISCSYAFMLPAATAPNAIVKGAANIKISDMMKVGFVMNLICVSTTVIMINTFGRLIFSFDTLPLWLTESDQVFAKCANVTNV